jgi:hypothetical protein
VLKRYISDLQSRPTEELLEMRHKRLRGFGVYTET